ncbi:hypothetical protein OIV83_006178 [Microbotryomycetes sp. JL201]|nr:hypothetical protein OIV83_006178 [Microbotryomycetes sp. JL201]
MVPIPEPHDKHSVPPLHLKALDITHPGVQQFFTGGISPADRIRTACQKVLRQLYPSNDVEFEPPAVRSVTVHLHSFDGIAYTNGSEIDSLHKELHLSSDYIAGVDRHRIQHEIDGILVHELVHAFQWDGSKHGGGVPGGVIEGIADWVRLREDLGPPHWNEGGSRWDAGYQTTAYFLAWLSKKFKNDTFVPELNHALSNHGWDGGKHLKRLCQGERIEELWETYTDELKKRKNEGGSHIPVPTHKP